MTKSEKSKKGKTENKGTEKKQQIRINLEPATAEKLDMVVSASEFKNASDYLEALLQKTFAKISDETTVADLKKIGKI